MKPHRFNPENAPAPIDFNDMTPAQREKLLYPNLGSGEDTHDRKPKSVTAGARHAMKEVVPQEVDVTDVTDFDAPNDRPSPFDEISDK